MLTNRGGVEDKRLEAEAKAKDTKKSEAKDTKKSEAKAKDTKKSEAKDQGHSRKRSPKKKVFKKVFQVISNL